MCVYIHTHTNREMDRRQADKIIYTVTSSDRIQGKKKKKQKNLGNLGEEDTPIYHNSLTIFLQAPNFFRIICLIVDLFSLADTSSFIH